jgi:murein DD-endopeptidase MepM/ murein hydrolase activator NlpD
MTFVATILGIPAIPAIREVNVRAGAALGQTLLFKAGLGSRGFVREVRQDSDNAGLGGRPYRWLRLEFFDGRGGWVRDDLIEVEGEGSDFGYGFVASRTRAFDLVIQVVAAPVAPAPPAPLTPPAPVSPPAAPANSTPNTPVSGPPVAITRGRDGVNVRSGPGVVNSPLARLPLGTRTDIIGAAPEQNNASRFRWVQIRTSAQTGWIREDFLRLDGDVTRFGLANADAYPSPVRGGWWVRDWNTDPGFAAVHYGWDIGAPVGEDVLAGPAGGTVIQVMRCTRCTPDRPNTLSQGLSLNDSRIFTDPAWGFGYGNFVVVRYLHDQLPTSARAELARRALTGYHLFVFYAHLHSMDVQVGQSLNAGQRIGGVGNTGNSEAAHLHLEIRAWNNPNETSTGRMLPNRLDPVVLFRR